MTVYSLRALTVFVSLVATSAIARAQVTSRGAVARDTTRPLAAGEIHISITHASDQSRGVPHALVCIAELGPTPLNDFLVADDRGELIAVNVPLTKLHLWIDQVGFTGRMIEIDASVKRSKGVRVTLARNAKDSRKEPRCPPP